MDSETIKKGIQKPSKIRPYIIRRCKGMFYNNLKYKYYNHKWNKLTEENKSINAEINGWGVSLHPGDDLISKILYYEREYDPRLTEYIKNNVSQGDTAIDVGAQIGYFTLHMAHQVGESGQVYSFEPHPDNFDILKKNISLNNYINRVELYNLALFDKKDELELSVHPSNKGMHSLINKRSDDSIFVKTREANNLIDEKIDFIKLDVEGAERRVISGASKLIKNNNPDIIFEYNKNLPDDENNSILSVLEKYGYKFTIPNGNRDRSDLSASEVIAVGYNGNIIAEC